MLWIVALLVPPLASAWFGTFKLAKGLNRESTYRFGDYFVFAGAHLAIAALMSLVTLYGADMLGAFSRSPDSGMAAGIGMAMFGVPAVLLSCTTQLMLLSTKAPS